MYPGGLREPRAKRRRAEVTGTGLNMASAGATRSGRAFAGPAVVSASTTVSAREQEQAAPADAGGSQL